ncbi:ABC transporter ATP-binding protein [Candidatus Saccharibacteria bacterium]|nr:ABC transporter ATP-binding protein [Candidatus Saccharibacteria bacterium]
MSKHQDQPAVIVSGLHKSFKLPHEQHSGIKQMLVNRLKGKKGFEIQHVLKNVSFEVKKGEFFGIVGKNGSGKSTLLKLLAGIYTPDKGKIRVNGSLTPFIELGVGFNHELTGRENVFMNGALLGFDHKEMEAMYDEIVEFAELGKFMDQKLKNYSSGMQVRLAFSIAIKANSDILIFDEVLAVGDAAFQQKCFDVFAELKKKGATIILVTHDMSSVLRFCDKAIIVDKGSVTGIGDPYTISDMYLELNYDNNTNDESSVVDSADGNRVAIESIEFIDANGKKTTSPNSGDVCRVGMKYINENEDYINFGFQIFNDAGVYCFGTNTKICGLDPINSSEGFVQIELALGLLPGNYYINVAIMNKNATSSLFYKTKAYSFRIKKDTQVEGISKLDYRWIR